MSQMPRPDFMPQHRPAHSVVVLVHGLFFRGFLMRPLGRYFAKRGYRVYIYDYASTRRKIREHGIEFRHFLLRLAEELPPEVELNIVTHSMGGLLARWALADERLAARVAALLMLAPPNSGSPVATGYFRKLKFGRWLVRPLAELRDSADSQVHAIPVPEIKKMGVIAGAFDQLVQPESTRLPGAQWCVVAARHREILRAPEARRKVVKFLKCGFFD